MIIGQSFHSYNLHQAVQNPQSPVSPAQPPPPVDAVPQGQDQKHARKESNLDPLGQGFLV